MKRTLGTTAALLLCGAGSLPAAELEVTLSGDRATVKVAGSPLSDVLDRMSKRFGMKVVYDGAPPRMLVAATLQGVTPPQAVVSMLEGQGVSYAMTLDRSGRRVETLLVLGAGGPGGKGPAAAAPAPEPETFEPAFPPTPELDPPMDEEPPPIEEPVEEQPEPEQPGGVPGLPGAPPPPEDPDRKPDQPFPGGVSPEQAKPFPPGFAPPAPVPDPTPPPGSE